MTHTRDTNEFTRMQHAGSEHRVGTGLVSALELSVTFETESIDDMPVYARLSNTRNHAEVEALLAALHGTERALVFGSGMAAMTAVLLTFLRPGDHILAQENCYAGNQGLLTKVMARLGIEHTFAPIDAWPASFRPNTKMAYLESISNPFCEPQDVLAGASAARARGCLTVCDNTFASPVNFRPALEAGVDFVLESATKYLNGHSDLVCGAIAGSAQALAKISETAMYLGGFLSTTGCVQLTRGLRTLGVRMERHNNNGRAFAHALAASPLVAKVYHGSLLSADDSRRGVFAKGFGGMCCVRFAPQVAVRTLMRSMSLVHDVPSLGGTETTACMPYHTTNRWMPAAERQRLGIDEQLVRFSVGLEDPHDIIQDVLAAAASASSP